MWNLIKFSLGMGIVTLVLYAGYTIVITLLPAGASANAIMRRASDILKHDPEVRAAAPFHRTPPHRAAPHRVKPRRATPRRAPQVTSYFGEIKTYGEDFGSSREGRRYYVPDYTYVDDLTDVKYHRIKFSLEGERGRKAWVWAEVRHGTYDFRYIIVLNREQSRVWSLVDSRPPERTLDERQGAVTSLLQDGGWRFYADADADIGEQGAVLGDYWLKVRAVRCEKDGKDCEAAGVPSRPAWAVRRPATWMDMLRGNADGTVQVVKGIKTVAELERMTKDLRKKQARTDSWLDRVRATVGL